MARGTTRRPRQARDERLWWTARTAAPIRHAAIRDALRLVERDSNAFGEGFREQRLRVGASQRDVARVAGVSVSKVWRLEHGDKRAAFMDAGEARPIFVALVLPPTRHRQALVRAHAGTIRAAFPVDPHRLRTALEAGGPWPGDGILWIGGGARNEPLDGV